MMNIKKSEVIVLMSGGIDSTAVIHYYIHNQFAVRGLFVDYGQAVAMRESDCAENIARFFKIKLDLVKAIFNKKFLNREIRGRNAFLIFTALMNYQGFKGLLSLGVHSGTSYYDCSNAFVNDISRIVSDYTNGIVSLDVPFIKWDKKMIFDYFVTNNLPLELTFSCERQASKPCGRCRSCLDRKALIC
jgi:7-cyano-7-deazaguanine synthase